MYAPYNIAPDQINQRLAELKTQIGKCKTREKLDNLTTEFTELQNFIKNEGVHNARSNQDFIDEINLLVFQRRKSFELQQSEIEEGASAFIFSLPLVDSDGYSSDDSSPKKEETESDNDDLSDESSEDEIPHDYRVRKTYGSI